MAEINELAQDIQAYADLKTTEEWFQSVNHWLQMLVGKYSYDYQTKPNHDEDSLFAQGVLYGVDAAREIIGRAKDTLDENAEFPYTRLLDDLKTKRAESELFAFSQKGYRFCHPSQQRWVNDGYRYGIDEAICKVDGTRKTLDETAREIRDNKDSTKLYLSSTTSIFDSLIKYVETEYCQCQLDTEQNSHYGIGGREGFRQALDIINEAAKATKSTDEFPYDRLLDALEGAKLPVNERNVTASGFIALEELHNEGFNHGISFAWYGVKRIKTLLEQDKPKAKPVRYERD